jgi:PAS domain S-box-containing protein
MEVQADPSIDKLDTLRLVHELQVHQIELEIQLEELQQTRAEVLANMNEYMELYDFAPVSYFSLDCLGNIRKVNLTGTSLLGVERSRLLNSRVGFFVSSDTLPAFNTFIRRVFEYRTKEICEVVLLTAAGSYISVQMQATVSDDNEDCRVAVTDITARKQAENALVESEERFRLMFERHLAIKLVLDPDTGSILDANEAAAQFYGWSVEQLKQMHIHQINTLPPETITNELGKAKSQSQVKFEFRHRIADGSIRDVEAFSSKIELAGKSVLYSIIHDITERNQLQKAFARVAERDRHISDIFQQSAMPRHIPILPSHYEIGTEYQPALQEADVCGDFFDFFDLGDGDIGISIGDIAGKGLPAAIRIVAAKNMIRSYAFLYNNPSKVMSLVNDALCRDIAMENDLLTAFYGVLDTRNNTLTYSNAGHEPPLLWRSSGKVESLTFGGPMFCGMGKQDYTESCLSIQDGDIFVTVTDGITEASISRNNQYGAKGIIQCLNVNKDSSADQIAHAILEDAKIFARGMLHDDASIIVIKKISDQATR